MQPLRRQNVLDTRDVHAQKQVHVRAQWEGGHLQAKQKDLRRNHTFWHPDHDLLDSKLWENKFDMN